MKQEHQTRRHFLKHSFSAGFMFFGGGMLIAACGNAENKKAGGAGKEDEVSSCKDYSKLSAEDLAARKKLGYTELSPDPDKYCKLCNLYKPPKEGASCGGCLLFKGPVEAEGTCTYWAPPA